jgi:hypothetical protein
MSEDELITAAAEAPGIINDRTSDVLSVRVLIPDGVVEQALSLGYDGETFPADIADWFDTAGARR